MSMDLEQIKRQNRIEEVIRETTGWTITGRGSILSTREHDSLKIFVDSQTYKRFSQDNDHGDVIAWLQNHNGWDFKQAVEWLCERAGVPIDWAGVDMAKWQATKIKREALTVITEFLHATFLRTAQAIEWAHGRGWTDDTIAKARLGYWHNDHRPALIAHLNLHEMDVTSSVVRAVLKMPDDYAVYPHWDGGRAVYLSCRTIRSGDKKQMAENGYPAHWNLPEGMVGPRQPFKNAAYRYNARHVVIVEGQADAITLAQWGIAAVALAGLTSEPTIELVKELKERHERLYVGMDDEEPGTDAYLGVMRAVKRLGITLGADIPIVRWPEGDANDWLQSGATAEDCQKLLAEAPCYAVFLAQEVENASVMDRKDAEEEAVTESARLNEYVYADNRKVLAELLAGGAVTAMDRKRRAALAKLPDEEVQTVDRIPAERAAVARGVNMPDDVMVRGKLTAAPADHEGHAQCVLALYPAQFAYVPEWGWLYWCGTHWVRTKSDASMVKRAIIEVLRLRAAIAIETQKGYLLRSCDADSNVVNGILQMVQAMVVLNVDDFDCYPDHLNTKNGVVDFRTGELIEHDSGWRFTSVVNYNYRPGLEPKLWVKYLWEAIYDPEDSQEDNETKFKWMRLLCGYLLTGRISEQIFIYLYGPPRSGKGLFTQTMQTLLGRPLSIETHMDTFTNTGSDTNNFHLAPLSAARLVVASETEKHKRMNAAVIKSLTGGDSIYASYKGKDHFNYRPVFKIVMSSNWPVNVDSEDEAVWARLRVIHFPNSHTGQEDRSLLDRLTSEESMEGILSWCVEGAVKWRKLGGLPYPDVLKRMADSMRENQDIVGIWLADSASITDPDDHDVFTPVALLYKHYADWCKEAGIRAKNRNTFTESIVAKGFEKRKRNHDYFKTSGWGFDGIALIGDGDGKLENRSLNL